jgi:hypothetical protein
MKQLVNCSSLVFLGVAAITAGCASSPSKASDGGGNGDASGAMGVALVADPSGFVGLAGSTNIEGPWYAYGDQIGMDGTTATGDCEIAHATPGGGHPAAECSMIATPPFGKFDNTNSVMCTSGTVAVVPMITGTTTADYDWVWGAGIGLDFNNVGGDGGVKMPYNATANGVTGISFDWVDMTGAPINPPIGGAIRVEFPTPTSTLTAAYWNGGVAGMANSPVKKGHNEFRWAAVGGPSYYMAKFGSAPPPFDPTKIISIQFHVPTNTTSSVAYSFCIANLTALTN